MRRLNFGLVCIGEFSLYCGAVRVTNHLLLVPFHMNSLPTDVELLDSCCTVLKLQLVVCCDALAVCLSRS